MLILRQTLNVYKPIKKYFRVPWNFRKKNIIDYQGHFFIGVIISNIKLVMIKSMLTLISSKLSGFDVFHKWIWRKMTSIFYHQLGMKMVLYLKLIFFMCLHALDSVRKIRFQISFHIWSKRWRSGSVYFHIFLACLSLVC